MIQTKAQRPSSKVQTVDNRFPQISIEVQTPRTETDTEYKVFESTTVSTGRVMIKNNAFIDILS